MKAPCRLSRLLAPAVLREYPADALEEADMITSPEVGRAVGAVALAAASIACGHEPAATTPTSPSCSFAVTAGSTSFGAAGGSGTATVTTTATCTWTASSEAAWIKVDAGTTHTGSGEVAFTVLPAEDTAARTGTLTVASRALSIAQEGRTAPPPDPCKYSVAASPDGFDRSGGNSQLQISTASQCAWTITRDATW